MYTHIHYILLYALFLQANGHNIITSTHDEVVNIIVNSGKKLHLKVVTPAVKPTGLSTIRESPKAIKKQKNAATPPQQSSLQVSHGIPNKPNPPAQVSHQETKNSNPVRPPPPPHSSNSTVSVSLPLPQEPVFVFPDVQKTVSTEQQNKSIKFPLMKSNTVSDVFKNKPQIGTLAKQFSEENIRPPSQFDSPTAFSRNSVEDENLSPFAIALRKASKAREERILTNQPRMSTTINKHGHDLLEEEVSVAITTKVQTGGNPITSSTTKENKIDSASSKAESIEVTDSTDSQGLQKSEDSPQIIILEKRLPVSNLIKKFSDDSQDATRSTPTNMEKTYENLDKQHPSHNTVPTNTEMKGKSVTMIAEASEGERADDGTYNWRDNLKSVKSSAVKSPSPNVEYESESTNIHDRAINRQMQGGPFTKKTSKTSLLAKKFEQNSMMKSESIVTKKVEKASKDLPRSKASTENVKQIPPSIEEEKPIVPEVKSISNDENSVPPVEQDVTSSAVNSLRRQSAVVMYEEGDINFPNRYERNSVSVDTDYWKSPEHATTLPAVSEVSNTSDNQIPHKITGIEILPEPDILPPPIISTDAEELALSIEDLPLPEFLPPPQIDDFQEFQDLPPPVDFPDSDFSQETPSFDITVPNGTHNTNTLELPSPSQLPPHYDTNTFELPSPSQLPPHYDDTDTLELPSLSQLPSLEEAISDGDDSDLVPEFHDGELALENETDENRTDVNEDLSDEKWQHSPLSISSTTALPLGTITDSNLTPLDISKNNMCDDTILQSPLSPSDLSDLPVPQEDQEKLCSENSDLSSTTCTSHDVNHDHEVNPDEMLSQVCIFIYLFTFIYTICVYVCMYARMYICQCVGGSKKLQGWID